MSKSAFDELSQCILSYHDWLKVDGLWDLLPNYQKFLTNKEHWHIIINVWSMAEHNSLDHNKKNGMKFLNLEIQSDILNEISNQYFMLIEQEVMRVIVGHLVKK